MWLTSTQEYLLVSRPPSTKEHHNEKLLEGDLHCFENADIDAESMMWISYTSFKTRRTKTQHKYDVLLHAHIRINHFAIRRHVVHTCISVGIFESFDDALLPIIVTLELKKNIDSIDCAEVLV
ncbi:hypothetical protein Tco_1049525 [Tanacetum coccineum]